MPEDWNGPGMEKLWLYNLHYFDTLAAGDRQSKTGIHKDLIDKWIDENIPGWGNGWEPYPLSLRIGNWIKWGLGGGRLSEQAVHSLAIQVRFLNRRLEFHLLGNHLLANAKALVLAGLFFDGDEADRWLYKGIQILERQLPEQVLRDGGHFELSPMYHAIILEDFLDLVNGIKALGHGDSKANDLDRTLRDRIPAMLEWLSIMCHSDGDIAFFNDAALGIGSRLADLTAYAGRLGFETGGRGRIGSRVLEASGYVRLETQRAVLLADVGRIGPDYLPGHAHADTLSFELSLDGKRVFVNSGISCYGNSEERLLQRGTAAHNTLRLGGRNSSEVWGGFRVARRAYPMGLDVEIGEQGGRIRCGHDGYARQRLHGNPVHWRTWVLGDHYLEIRDRVAGANQVIEIFFHLYPETQVDLESKTIRLGELKLSFDSDVGMEVVPTLFYPEFGKAIPNLCLKLRPENNKSRIRFQF